MNILFLVFSALICYFALWWLIPILREFSLDHPNSRSSHHLPTPRSGGIAFVAFALTSSGIALLSGQVFSVASLPLLVAPLAVVGLLDDRYNLPSSWRYFAQLVTAIFILITSPLVQQFVVGLPPNCWYLIPTLALLAITATSIINFTNFMDGLDGLVAGSMSVTIVSLAIAVAAPWPFWVLVGSLFGFLFWNWSPAKVFMGDVGSTFLGAVFFILVLQASTWLEALAYLLVATPLLADASLCVSRRFLAGQRVFQAHRLHLFQRLHQAGWPHARVSSLYIAATTVLSLALLCGGLPWVITFAAFELLIAIWLDQRVAVSFARASRN